MTGLLRTFVIAFVLFFGIGYIVYQIIQFALSVSGKNSQLSRDVNALRAEIDGFLDDLVPLDEEELSLLSLNQIDKKSNVAIHSVTKGVFTSIYQEPLVAYAYKEYSGSNYRVLVAQTYNDEYLYVTKDETTDVYYNDDKIGFIEGSEKLYSENNGQTAMLARIEADRVLSSHPIYINNREVGEVNNPIKAIGHTPRAFQQLESMNGEEKKLFLALSFLSLVSESDASRG